MIKIARGSFGEEELEEVRSAFDYGYLGLGHKVDEFENELKKFLNANYVVATNTGTSALHLALEALEIKPGDEVIVPSLTFVASFQAISAARAVPIPCDVYPDTLLMDMEAVNEKISKRTRAIMPVHYGGNPCDMKTLLEIKKDRGIRIVEDAAHAFGSTYFGKKIGGFGDITCFSFDSIKNITCAEGGAIVCNEPGLVEKLKIKRLLGIDRKNQTSLSWKERGWSYDVVDQGFRYHMSNLNAAIGLAQLKKVETFISRRREICVQYVSEFKNISSVQLLPVDYSVVAPHIFVILVLGNKRDKLIQFLKDRDIESSVPYVPNHLHSFYRTNTSFPNTDKVFNEILALPLHTELSDEDVWVVISSVKEFFSK
ncbi:MAG: DegT/DnrJ/EryC1/StrS family aminotransferase [Nitrospina sp.]|jgi:dTDP-4-amino-4,6-dideoxygalactose transaminase|nr:DegT/DnrJ/EryC1/StrS family aminotransferase [Nitrospina sp.]MBT4046715.1 DegT/DnrJ/EryC1/StrS family aminotransferase [Nitrospina sp.]MBT4558530.1 DegT/DnrJ/EryC1/StrS family aminotransferase [Nitrospina sp.]MBT6738778.1 DegT/DnrJ/EryC1/StrS family aminotransferase [Nitrospina sp.]MBT7681222.1 DegT/DnrJ/EryC1/StrS family aminotransferase [Nitrospina sp.]